MGDAESTKESMTSIRYFFPGQRRQDGKISRREVGFHQTINAAYLYSWLSDESVRINRYVAFVYDRSASGYVRLDSNETAQLSAEILAQELLDIKLEVHGELTEFAAVASSSLKAPLAPLEMSGGWFGIGIFRGKTEANHGTLWRTALTLGASFVFTIGQRYRSDSTEVSNDTFKTYRHIPMLRYSDMGEFSNSCPYSAPWIAVEMGGAPLTTFRHPLCGVYILGAEDHGLPKSVVSSSAYHITLPAARPEACSYNVATAGAIVMYDRVLKNTYNVTG
ncbi:hypothetical protein NDN08_003707 [Rhodosorus marinus]|uniref:tRNA/rRNA methyltransferase SpoU type domain-containing protein n=1 Tax=Rhodosorus marinus TaxID=101924 RepID=A0AAV8V369_9RHOD|nr:hypothetical protein NDN08_003707 [Rhodosorus marinus]